MFFQTKKKKIQQYLNNPSNKLSVFDELLADYLSGDFKSFFIAQGLTKVEIYIDWLEDYKCIGLQGRFDKYYVDLQIEENEFGMAIDPDEPDISNSYELISKEYVYETCKHLLTNANSR